MLSTRTSGSSRPPSSIRCLQHPSVHKCPQVSPTQQKELDSPDQTMILSQHQFALHGVGDRGGGGEGCCPHSQAHFLTSICSASPVSRCPPPPLGTILPRTSSIPTLPRTSSIILGSGTTTFPLLPYFLTLPIGKRRYHAGWDCPPRFPSSSPASFSPKRFQLCVGQLRLLLVKIRTH